MILFLFIFCANLAWGQMEDGRPLRSVRPASSYSASTSSEAASFYSQLVTPLTLEEPLTRRFIEWYSSPGGISVLNAVLQRGYLYLPFIRAEVAAMNLPEELAYLPIVESGFQITARSRSGAVGLWQFMMNSISPYDMKVSDFIDERRDFIKSTKGALQKLEENYRTLGSWELALAAYNSGLGAINRVIQRTGINDYWELVSGNHLKQETANFVPRLIAIAYVLSRPRRFGVNVWHENFEWTAIPLPRQISLDVLAQETGIDISLLRSLNAELLHGISPIDDNYRLKVPTAHLETINAVLEREDLKLIRYHYHVVRGGDTLWSMSRHYGATLNMIEQHNPGISNRYLRLGETVIIPAFADVEPPSRAAAASNFSGSHTVQRGESFWSLSRVYNIDPEVLAEENGMRLNQILHEGRTIKVPIIN